MIEKRQLTKGQVDNLQALRTVSSLMTISVVSALGLETLAAIAAASVSRMILDYQQGHIEDKDKAKRTYPSSTVSSAANKTKSNPSNTFLLST